MRYYAAFAEHFWIRDNVQSHYQNTMYEIQRAFGPVIVASCSRKVAEITIPLHAYNSQIVDCTYYGDLMYWQDRNVFQSRKTLSDMIAMQDVFRQTVSYRRMLLEGVRCRDGFTHWFILPPLQIYEGIRLVETKPWRVNVFADEPLHVDESFIRSFNLKRFIVERIGFREYLVRYGFLYAKEPLSVYDAYVRTANAVLEALQISGEVFTVVDFESQMNKLPFYEEFIDFNVGDYEYEKAVMRLQVISHATHSQPLLYNVSAHVDIDDTNDRGTVTITDTTAATKVYYNKFYYNAPEVQVTVSGGTGDSVMIPHILRTDGNDVKQGRYFEVELRDNTGKRVTGVISWASKGW